MPKRKKYVKKKVNVSGYTRKDGTKVKGYSRKQKVLNPRLGGQFISLEKAKKIHENRSKQAQSSEEVRKAEKSYKQPRERWKAFPEKYDIDEIDNLEGFTLHKEHRLKRAAKNHTEKLKKRGVKVKRHGTKIYVKFEDD